MIDSLPFSVIVPTIVNPEGLKDVAEVVFHCPEAVLIVIDNSETLYGADILKEFLFGSYKYFPQDENLRVNASWNLGADHALNGPVLFLNDDVTIKSPKVLQAMASTIERYNCWVCADTVDEFSHSSPTQLMVPVKDREGWCFGLPKHKFKPIPGGPNMPVNFYGDDWLFNLCFPSTYKLLGCEVIHDQGYSSSRIRKMKGLSYLGDQEDADRAKTSGII